MPVGGVCLTPLGVVEALLGVDRRIGVDGGGWVDMVRAGGLVVERERKGEERKRESAMMSCRAFDWAMVFSVVVRKLMGATV